MSQCAALRVLMVIVPVALAGCTSMSKEPTVDPNIYPTKFRQEILDTLKETLDDPTNVREAALSDPVLTTIDKEQRYTSCVRYNPRNLRRQYTGVTERIAYYYGGHLNQLVEASKGQCTNAVYKPFPELEKLCLAKKCL